MNSFYTALNNALNRMLLPAAICMPMQQGLLQIIASDFFSHKIL